MNWKKIFTIAALTGFSASVATGQGTAPTIVQGDYISNVFGQSNFVKNPNAKLNNANVTVSSATVTRSTTTPLVATSEFNITTSTSTGYADWSTRTFDAGMKNQNCEARFTYRGFSVGTTKAQLIQNSLVVAELTLTASTDPRIVSINFPCGDLSTSTVFRLQQSTAALTGTNEIGGIYVGLATNMANVAQAELYGTVTMESCSSPWSTSGSGSQWESFPTRTGCTYSPTGKASAPSTNIPAIQFSNLPAGNYQIVLTGAFGRNAAQTGAIYFRARTTDGTFTSNPVIVATTTTAQNQYAPSATFYLNITSGGTRTIEIQGFNNTISTAAILGVTTPDTTQISVYRFPTSSELVVTPERQNTFASVRLYANTDSNGVTSASWTKLTAGSTATRITYGKADTTATNDYSITIKNMPVGSYDVSTTGTYFARAAASPDVTGCWFSLSDSPTAATPFAAMAATGFSGQDVITSTLSGVYVNTSVADRTFYVRAYRSGGTGSCRNFSGPDLPTTITVIPLDQPSNSALYVQGPVLAPATGNAVATGYVGEEITGTATTAAGFECAKITVPPGQWILYGTAYVTISGFAAPATYDIEIDDSSGTFPATTGSFVRTTIDKNDNYLVSTFRIVRTSTTVTRYLNCRNVGTSTKTNSANSTFKGVRLN